MTSADSYSAAGQVSRRRLLRGAVVTVGGLAGAVMVGCSSAPAKPAATAAAPQAGGTAAPVARKGMPVVKGTPKKGGTFTSPLIETNPQHDQHTALSNTEWTIMGERALEMDEWSGALRGNIVETWEVPDANTFILKVKKGVKMHDRAPWNGREFDAADVAWNLTRLAGLTAEAEGLPKASFQRATFLAGIAKAETTDKYTVKVTMAKPNSAFLNGITEIRSPMMPKDILDIGFKDPMKFGGFGPFMITENVPGSRQVYSRFDGYYRPNEPYFDKYVQTVIPDRAATMAAFISKQVSTLGGPTAQEIKTIEAARPDALRYSYIGVGYAFIKFNFKVKAFQDVRVRQALNLVGDREEIANGFYGQDGGWGWVASSLPSFPGAWDEAKVKTLAGWNPLTKEKDRVEASKLLAAAGYADGDKLQFEMMFRPGGAFQENAVRYQAQMVKQFPKIKNTIVGPATNIFDKRQIEGDFEAISYTSTAAPDIVLEASAHWHSKGSRNYGKFPDIGQDAVLDKALGQIDMKARIDTMNAFQEKFVTDWLPHVQWNVGPMVHFVQPNLGGFDKTMGPWDAGRGIINKTGRWYEV